MTSERSRRSYGVGVRFGDRLDTCVVDAQQPHGHHDHVAIAGGLERCRHMVERHAGCGRAPARCPGAPRCDRARDPRREANRTYRALRRPTPTPHRGRRTRTTGPKRRSRRLRQQTDRRRAPAWYEGLAATIDPDQQSQRNLAASETQIYGRAKWLRGVPSPGAGQAQQQSTPASSRWRRRSLAPAMRAAAAGDNQEHHRGGSDIDGPRGSAEARVQRCEACRQRSSRRCPVEHSFRVCHGAIHGRKKNEQRQPLRAPAPADRVAIQVLPDAAPHPPTVR